MRKGLLAYLTPLLAIALAGIAGLISILGMSKLFAGQAEIVMVVMGIIESGKVVGASILHNKWKDKGYKVIKWILLLMVVIAMAITSWGVYGFFTDAYQQTASALSIDQKEIQLIENKKQVYQNNIETINDQIEFKNNQAQGLIDLRTTQESRLDSLIANGHWVNVKKTQQQIADANDDLERIQADIDTMYMDVSSLQDSIGKLDIKILEMEGSSEASAELGPLIYIAKVFDTDMDTVVNYVMLFIMVVFDPFAMVLIVITNKMWKRRDDDQDNDQGTTRPPTKPNKPLSGTKIPIVEDIEDDIEPVEENDDPTLIEEDDLRDVIVTKKSDKILSSERDAEVFFDAIENPKEPNEELVKLANEYQKSKKPLGKYDLKFGPEYTKMMEELHEEVKEEETSNPETVDNEKTAGEDITETWRNILKKRKEKRNNNGISRV